MQLKRLVVLGSTGTIGQNTLKVVARHPGRFKIVGLTAFHNTALLLRQIRVFRPAYVAVSRHQMQTIRQNCFLKNIKILDAETELERLASLPQVDLVVIGITGSGALRPFLAALRQGKIVAPANKEALVMAGDILMRAARRYKARIIPIDSEQSAIFQCLQGRRRSDLKKVYLTASGGPLAKVPLSRFSRLKLDQVLKHPRWKMGPKITVDSATLMNKGFEIIEAQRLFNLKLEDIQVVIHPEAVIHSMVSFKDGSILAQMGITDMRLPIQYALSYPECWDAQMPDLDFFSVRNLSFGRPDERKFPCLGLARAAARQGKTYPCVLEAADEMAVEAFLQGRISFNRIHAVVDRVLQSHRAPGHRLGIKDIEAAAGWAKEQARRMLGTVTPRSRLNR